MEDSSFTLYARPESDFKQLPIPPRLASWDAKTHPSQLQLTEYLDSVEQVIGELGKENLALDLTIGLPPGTDILGGGRDLDNYLHPVASRLGSRRFVSVWAEKQIGVSSVSVSGAVAADPTYLSGSE